MSKIEKIFFRIDRKVDFHISFVKMLFKRYFPVFSVLFFTILIFVFVFRVFYSRPRIVASIIEDDIKLITLVLEKIDVKCNILKVEDDHNEIDFLNVESFSGSQVGPLSLAYPAKWEGPYLKVNPTMQEKFYEIVCAKDGMFVVPGMGVCLPNGFVVGKDFEITPETEISLLIKEGGMLAYDGKKFALELKFKIGDWDPWHLKEETIKNIDHMLQEFNEAMPFTCNSYCRWNHSTTERKSV